MKRMLIVVMIAFIFSGCGSNSNNQIKGINNIVFLEDISIEYGEDISKKVYDTKTAVQELSINLLEDIDPKVDSMIVGESEHTFVCDEGIEYKFNIKVQDTQFPKITGEDKYTVILSEELSLGELLKENVIATDPVDGDIELIIEDQTIEKIGEYTVQVSAIDLNNNTVNKSITIVVEDEQTQESNLVTNLNPVITYKDLVSYKDIGFKTIRKNDASVAKGEEVISQKGVVGQNKIITTVKYADGKEVSRLSKTELEKSPINKIILVGTKVMLTAVTSCPEISAMVNKINVDRQKVGLNALSISGELTRGAGVRVLEITEKFSHDRLDGTKFWTVSSLAFGENIAYGSADGVITHGRFMDSPGHKDNILNTKWKTVGIATVQPEGKPTYWVVLFGK